MPRDKPFGKGRSSHILSFGSISLDRPIFTHVLIAPARGAAGAGSAAVTALELDVPNDVAGQTARGD